MRKVRFLGTGTSTGVPTIGCTCDVCLSENPKDKRLRTSLLYAENNTRLLFDCGPDFRQQMLKIPFRPISAVLLSHEHYDHVAGLDDLRAFSAFGELPIYADRNTANHLRERMPYCFVDKSYPGIPKINLEDIDELVPFSVGGLKITPIRVMHGALPILGYKIGDDFAYITDMLTISAKEAEKLKGIKFLVVNALRMREHPTHQSLKQALSFTEKVGAEQTYFIHMSHDIGLHEEIEQKLPNNSYFAYDELEVEF